MKKLISVILCLSLLFSLGVFAAAEDVPQLAVVAYKDNTAWIGAAVHEDYVCFDMMVTNCTQLESFELLITYNPAVLEYSAHYPFLLDEIVRNSIDCTTAEPGKLCVIGTNDGYGADFDPFCFKVIGEGDTDISVELVSFRTADGEVEDVVLDASIENFTATENDYVPEKQPEIYFYGDPPAVQYGVPNFETGMLIGMLLRGEIRNCANLERCEIAICFDPWVMEYTMQLPDGVGMDWESDGFVYSVSSQAQWLERDVYGVVIEICRDTTTDDLMVGRINDPAAESEMKNDVLQFRPLQFMVYNPGETEIYAKILSWTDTDGNTIEGNVTFSEGVQNAMSAEDYEAMTAMPSCMTGDAYYYYWTASENLTVAQLTESAPDTADVVIMNADQSRELSDDELIGTGCRYCIIINGETYFSKLLIVKNDLDGNGQITAEDARLALRFAVGLDTATQAQRRAAGVAAANDFTAEIARTILRRAVGLDA